MGRGTIRDAPALPKPNKRRSRATLCAMGARPRISSKRLDDRWTETSLINLVYRKDALTERAPAVIDCLRKYSHADNVIRPFG